MLYARRVELLEELKNVEAAISAKEKARPVRLRLRRNIRNTGYLTTSARYAREQDGVFVLAYKDQSLRTPADDGAKECWVDPQGFAKLKAEGLVDGDYISVA